MSKSKNKVFRYKNLMKRVVNWKYYLWRKTIGFQKDFEFEIKKIGKIKVPKNMFGPFRENFLDDIYFKHIPEFVFRNSANPVILDVGANVGYFSLAAFSRFSKAIIYAFEPHPYCFKVLTGYQKKFECYNWRIFNQALSNKSGKLMLNTSTVKGFTTMASVFSDKHKVQSFSAETNTLNVFIKQNKILNIDFMKLDCEGSEYSILYSLEKHYYKNIKSMCIETHKGKESDQNLNFLNNYLINLGYKTKVLDEGKNSGYIWAWKP